MAFCADFLHFSMIIICSCSRTASRVTTVVRMEAGDHSDVLVCASEDIADRLYFVTLKGGCNSYMTSETIFVYL